MTVIVASVREGLMASDSMCLDNDETWFPAQKIHRARGALVGFAGAATDMPALVEWMRKPEKRRGAAPVVDETSQLLILYPGRVVTWDAANGFFTIERDWHAIGTGAPAAQVAMLAGVGAKRAAQLVVQVISSCAGRVVTRRLRRTPA